MAKKSKPRKPKRTYDPARAEQRAAANRRKQQRRVMVVAVIALVALIAPLVATLLIDDNEPDDEASAPDETPPTLDIPELPAPPPGVELDGPTPCPELDGSSERTTGFIEAPTGCLDADTAYQASILTDRGEIVVALDLTEYSAADTFGSLALYHFYDGLPFHFVLDEGLVFAGATGDPVGTGSIPFTQQAEPDETRTYGRGTVAMITNQNGLYDTRFLISGTDDADAFLTIPDHPVIGEVVEGLEVVDDIAASGAATGVPTTDVRIESITITEV